MSRREYTQNVKNWHATFNRKYTPWCLCQNEKSWLYYLLKIVSARTYQNLKENRSIFTEIQSIFHKYADVIICKLEFWIRRPLSWRHELIEGQMRHEKVSPNHTLLKYEIKLGSSCILKSYYGFCIGMFLPIYAMYYKSSRAREFMLNGRSFRY